VDIIWHDLRSNLPDTVKYQIDAKNKVDYILHIGASSHVDRSISDPMSFVYDNVVGTANMLEYARKVNSLTKFLYFSTDEVFGPSLGNGYKFKPWDRYHANNPYSATKAGGEELCVAYFNTYKLPVLITHCMNIIGERQHPEKYMPRIVKHLLLDDEITVHTDDSGNKPGKRHYIYADEVSNAVLFLLEKGVLGEKYNIEGQVELNNLELAQYIAKRMNVKLKYKLIPGKIDRPGCDYDYAISPDALLDLGYQSKVDFWQALDKTIDWYTTNKHWIIF